MPIIKGDRAARKKTGIVGVGVGELGLGGFEELVVDLVDWESICKVDKRI